MKTFYLLPINKLLGRALFLIRNLINSHPYLWAIAWKIIPRLKFLLPHDKSYYGFLPLAKESGLFLDVGANNGISALGFNSILPSYAIYSIEANPQHEAALATLKRKLIYYDYLIVAAGNSYDQLSLHIAQYGNVALHTAASVNPSYMKNAFHNNYTNRILKKLSWDTVVVNVMPLDDLNLRPDLIKIDVEGFDYEVLLGLKKTIAACRPSILIEYSDASYENYKKFCSKCEYEICIYDNDKLCFMKVNPNQKVIFRKSNIPLNLFLVPKEKCLSLRLSIKPLY